MKLYLPLLFLSLLLSSLGYGQAIFNFEEWETVNGNEVPSKWLTNQDSTRIRIRKSSQSFEGSYAMQMISNANGHFDGCVTSAVAGIKLEHETTGKDSLSFAFKILPSPGSTSVYFLARIRGFKDGVYQASLHWEKTEEESEYIKASIPITEVGFDSLSIEYFNGGLANGFDQCTHKCQSWIDDIKFISGLTNSVTDNDIEVRVYPNPSTGILFIDKVGDYNYELFNIQGVLIDSGIVNDQIEVREKGVYYLRLYEDEKVVVHKVIVQ